MRLTTTNKELKTTCLFFKSVILNGVVSAPFIFLSLLPLLAVFWHSVLCRSRAGCSCAFCTCSNSPPPGEHWTALVLNGWRWWGAGKSRQGWQHSWAGGSCWLCTSLCAAQRGHARAVHWEVPCGVTRACADADRSRRLQDLLMLDIACDLEKLCFQFSIISRTSTHAVLTPVAYREFGAPLWHFFS